MAPFLYPKTKLIVDPQVKYYHIGDVVVFLWRHSLVAHRVIWTKKKSGQVLYLLKGDFNNEIDGAIPRSSIIGKVIGYIDTRGEKKIWAKWSLHLSYFPVLYSWTRVFLPWLPHFGLHGSWRKVAKFLHE